MDILYYDADLVACIKPVGIDSEHEVPQVLSEALGGPVLPVHRLDKNVVALWSTPAARLLPPP